MKQNKIIGYALLHAALAVGYIAFIATVMTSFEGVFPGERTILAPITFLLLFVVSAVMMGLILFGRPVLWYLEEKKKEAISLALYTIAFLGLIALSVVLLLLSGVLSAVY